VKLSRSSGKNQEEQIGRWCPGAVLVERYYSPARPPRVALLFAAVSSKKTYAGRVRSAKPEPEDSPELSLSHPHTRGRDAPNASLQQSPQWA